VEFEDPEDVKDAIDNMDQSELFGKVIKVNAAKPPKNVNEGLGSKTALWEQVFFELNFPVLGVSLTKHPRRAG
jgi:RNA recognition motif-containing protein